MSVQPAPFHIEDAGSVKAVAEYLSWTPTGKNDPEFDAVFRSASDTVMVGGGIDALDAGAHLNGQTHRQSAKSRSRR